MDDRERKIREGLAKSLGVEFLSPEDVDNEINQAAAEMEVAAESATAMPPAADDRMVAVSVNDIMSMLRAEWHKIPKSSKSKGKRKLKKLLQLAGNAVHQLATQLDEANRRIEKLQNEKVTVN